MAFFNIKRKEIELTPAQLDEQIKNVKEQIKTCKSDILQIKNDYTKNIKDINSRMAAEKASFEEEIKKITAERNAEIKKAKDIEKKKSAKLKEAQDNVKKAKSRVDDVKNVQSSEREKQLKINKRDLQIQLAQVESDFNLKKDNIESEHNKTIDNFKSLIDFEEKAIKDAKQEKENLIEKYEAKLEELHEKKVKMQDKYDSTVETMNKDHDEKINEINLKMTEDLSEQKAELKQLYLDLDTLTEKRNKTRDDFYAEKAALEKELETTISNNEKEIKSALKLNESLEIEAKKTQDNLDALIDKHNTEYSDLKFLLSTLVSQMPEDLKEVAGKNKIRKDEKDKELSQRLVELKRKFDEDIKERNSELENEINNIRLTIEKNNQAYNQILKDNIARNEHLVNDYQQSLNTVTNEKDNLYNELRALEGEYKEQIKNFNSQLNDTKTNNKLYIDQLKSKFDNETQELINAYETKKINKINELKDEIREAKTDIRNINTEFKQYLTDFENKKNTLITQHEKEISALNSKRDSLNSSIKLLNEELDSRREIFAKDLEDINTKIDNLKNEKIIKLQELEVENENKLKELQEENDKAYAGLLSENEKKLKKINAEADDKKRELDTKLHASQNEFETKKQKVEKETNDIKAKYDAQINKVLDQQNDLTNQIATLKDNITNSEELFKQELSLLTHNFEENKNKLEQDYNAKVSDLAKQYEDTPNVEINALKAQLEEAKANYAGLNVELLEKKNQMQYDYSTKKSELQARQDEISKEIEKKNDLLKELTDEKEDEYKAQAYRLNEKKTQLEELKNEIKEETDRINALHNEDLARLTENYNAKYNEAVSKYNEEEMILRERLEGELQYVTRDYDRKKADLDVQLNEVSIRKDQIESDLKARYNAELEKSRAIENEVKILQDDLNFKKVSFDAQLENKRKQFDNETAKFKAQQNEDLAAQKAHYMDVLAELQVKKEQLTREIDLLAYEYNDKAKAVEDIRQTQNKDLSLLRIQLTQLIEQFNKNDVFGEKQAKLELMYDRRIAEIKKDFTAIVDEFDNLQETREGVGNITKSNELEITRKTEEFKRVLDALDVKHNETINELKNQYDTTLKQIAEDFKLYIQGNKDAINDCENEIISLQATYDGLIKEEEAKIVKLDAEKTLHNRQIELIQKQFDAKIKQIDDNYTETSDEDKVKAQYTFEQERRSYENQIDTLKSEIENLEQPKPTLNLKLRDLSKQKNELETDMFDKKQKLIELLDEAFRKIAGNYRDRVELKKAELKQYDIYSNNKINIFKK